MDGQISLMELLQQGHPSFPSSPPDQPEAITNNPNFSPSEVIPIPPGVWAQFNLPTILQEYQALLTSTMVAPDPFPGSPLQPVTTKGLIESKFQILFCDRVRRGLRRTFEQLRSTNQYTGVTNIAIGHRDIARAVLYFRPDVAYYVPGQPSGSGPNRAPGIIMPSWVWNSAMATGSARQQMDYRYILSRLNYYMRLHKAQYGFLATEEELFAARRLDDEGSLELSPSIYWETEGSTESPRLTLMLALWYLGMLASQEQGPGSGRE
ncbi:hypothetical protein FQN49_007029 [Arthroderma sp. PD_2]|nr:hypothetical protein FQN49_007029 [Arthroderma sp. PD_2]